MFQFHVQVQTYDVTSFTRLMADAAQGKSVDLNGGKGASKFQDLQSHEPTPSIL